MEFFRQQKKILAGIVFLAFFASGILALNLYGPDQSHGMIQGCPYMNGDSSMCPMNLTDHLSAWKQTFTSDFSLNLKIVTLILFISFLPFILFRVFIRYFPLIRYLSSFENQNLHFKLFDWIVLALRRGVLEPKVYAELRILA